MSAVVNARDVLLQGAATRYVTPELPGTLDFANVTGPTKPENNATVGATWGVNIGSQPNSLSGINAAEGAKLSGIAAGADVTSTILSSSGTSIVMSNASLFKSSSGIGGVFIGSGGLVGKDSGGSTTFAIDGSTGAASFRGDITGASNINITGNAYFAGATTEADGFGYTLVAGQTRSTLRGIVGYGKHDNSQSAGVVGYSGNSGFGIAGVAEGSGYGLYSQGRMGISANNLVNNFNADLLDGNHASAFATAGHNHDSTYLGINAQATDSAQLGGFGTGSWVRQTGVTAGGPGAATHTLTIVTGGITARIGIVYP